MGPVEPRCMVVAAVVGYVIKYTWQWNGWVIYGDWKTWCRVQTAAAYNRRHLLLSSLHADWSTFCTRSSAVVVKSRDVPYYCRASEHHSYAERYVGMNGTICPSVRPSVCRLSQAGIKWRQMTIGSGGFYRRYHMDSSFCKSLFTILMVAQQQ